MLPYPPIADRCPVHRCLSLRASGWQARAINLDVAASLRPLRARTQNNTSGRTMAMISAVLTRSSESCTGIPWTSTPISPIKHTLKSREDIRPQAAIRPTRRTRQKTGAALISHSTRGATLCSKRSRSLTPSQEEPRRFGSTASPSLQRCTMSLSAIWTRRMT